MNPIQTLREEHEGISQALLILQRMTDLMEAGKELELNDAKGMADFFSGFADACHHAKEEESLFPLIANRMTSMEYEKVEELLDEHVQGRKFLEAMRNATDQFRNGNTTDFIESSRKYIDLLNAHIQKEESAFLLMENLLTDTENDSLNEAFEKIENEKIGKGKHEQYHRTLDELKIKYL